MFLKKVRSAVRFSATINITAALISVMIFFNIFAVFQIGLVSALSPFCFHIYRRIQKDHLLQLSIKILKNVCIGNCCVELWTLSALSPPR